ncbi:hypothetical protein TIFTF001_039172 [Ficus carica]|uniref:DUF8039 domain-containing protein n=1 Tax=Ficus carica TaxID=3494 RepID=A0AA88JDN9_FICCA|nr:hypothetical protein TIFTF001_039172 [Ficus carica]
MKLVHMARKRGERIEVTFDEKGQLEGKHGDELMSWIGVLAREHVSIWIQDWRSRDLGGLKEIIWKEAVTPFTFKKTEKSEKRDGLWLDSQTGSDGELKDPACKKVSELIESQGTFESVGTTDVLTQALSRPKHPDRIRGQSKFVKQSQYFNLNRSSNRDSENVTTIDQYNSCKASCSIQEKQPGVADPPTMPVDSQQCKLYIFDELHGRQLLVAFGRAWLESLRTDTVHGIPLGEGNVRVLINVPKLKKAALPIPTYEATTVDEAVNGFVAWPKTLVEIDMSMNKASRGPIHVPDQAVKGNKCQKKLGKKNDQLSN